MDRQGPDGKAETDWFTIVGCLLAHATLQLMVDPDAPSPDNPKWADFLHWAVTNITCGDTGHGNVR